MSLTILYVTIVGLNAGENMKVITEERLRKFIGEGNDNKKLEFTGLKLKLILNSLLEEIDTLTVSKLRPMVDAPNDGSIFLAKHEFNDELEETWSTGGGEFSTSQFCDLRIDTFDGWIPKPIYKSEKE